MINELVKLAKKKGYEFYEQPFKLNIWGFRSPNTTPNSFDDEMHVAVNVAQTGRPKWLYLVFKCTTDPGTFWLKNPMHAQGTAILNPGQYINAYQIGLHRGQYKALVQSGGKVSVTRDYNRNAVLDFGNGRVMTGSFGINIHRANKEGSTYSVDKYSAGCQVFKNAADFDFFLKLCEMHRHFHGNRFTYTLVDERMEGRSQLKTLAIGGILVALLIGGYFLVTSDDNE